MCSSLQHRQHAAQLVALKHKPVTESCQQAESNSIKCTIQCGDLQNTAIIEANKNRDMAVNILQV